MNYSQMRYIYPPRPTTRLRFGSEFYNHYKSESGWTAQYKLDGQRNVIYIAPDGSMEFWNRHKEKHRNYYPPIGLQDSIRNSFNRNNKWLVLDSELMHTKGPFVKNTVYIYDILVYDNVHLTYTTFQHRYDLLRSILLKPIITRELYDEVDNGIWLARNINQPEWDICWNNHVMQNSWVEGYVLKDLRQQLLPGLSQHNNDGWMIRCRKKD